MGPPPEWQPAPAVAGSPGAGSGGRILAVIGVVVALVAAGLVSWNFFWPRGGAGSPEGAVEQLLAAGTAQDPVGMLDVLNPAEVEGLDDVYAAALERAEDADLVEGDGLLDALSIELTDLELEVDELGEDIARVTIVDGRYDVSWDPDQLPERLDFLAEETDQESESGDLSDLFDGDEPYLTTVQVDGRWYVSVIGTLTDIVHTEAEDEIESDLGIQLPEPDYDLASEEIDPVTGADPEEVIDNLFGAITDGHPDRLLANLPADLVLPLRPYLPLFEAALDEVGWPEETSLELTAEDLDLSTEDLGDGLVKVVIDGGRFEFTAREGGDVEEGWLEIDGDCVEGDDGHDTISACLSDDAVAADAGLDEIFFVVSEVDGGYQFDPVATYAEYGALLVASIDGDVVDDLIEDLEDELRGESTDF